METSVGQSRVFWPISAPPGVDGPPLDRATRSHHPVAGDAGAACPGGSSSSSVASSPSSCSPGAVPVL